MLPIRGPRTAMGFSDSGFDSRQKNLGPASVSTEILYRYASPHSDIVFTAITCAHFPPTCLLPVADVSQY
jgi:hypothetical protein